MQMPRGIHPYIKREGYNVYYRSQNIAPHFTVLLLNKTIQGLKIKIYVVKQTNDFLSIMFLYSLTISEYNLG